MKKILSLIVVLSIIATCLTFPVAGSSDSVSAETAFELLSALEIMVGDESGDPRLGDNMTRAEFAQLMSNVLLYQFNSSSAVQSAGFFDDTLWAKNFFGNEENYNELMYPDEKTPSAAASAPATVDFDDVPKGHWAYDAVSFARNYGIMQGNSKTIFNPDENIRTNEVIKCLLVIMGYKDLAELEGGYPNGYVYYAQNLRITNGVENSEFITRGSIAIMLNNCMEVKMLKFSSISKNDNIGYDYDADSTFLTEVLGLEKIKGMVTDNGYTSLIEESTYDGRFIAIDNTRLEVPEGANYSTLIGRDVECWYKNSKTDDFGKVVYVRLSNKDKVTEIDGDYIDGVSVNPTKILYTKEGSHDIKHIDVSDAYVIYNGLICNEYEKNIFDIDYGTVKVIEPRNNNYNKIVVIEDFETWYVSNIDSANNIIFNGLKSGKNIGDNDILELILDNPEYKITFLNADGSAAQFENIKKGSVLDIMRNGKLVTIYISNNVISDFRIAKIRNDEGKLFVSDGENEFEVTKAFENYGYRDEIRVDDIVTLHLNNKNRVAWAVNQVNSDLTVAYIIHCGNPNKNIRTNESYALKLYTLGDVFKVYNLAQKVEISDDQGDVYKMDDEKYYSKYKDYTGICRYLVNDDDEISYIEFPILDSNTTISGKLHLILETTDETKGTDGYFRANQINSFGAKALLNSDSKVINYNPDPEVEDEASFSIGSVSSFSDDSDNIVKLYSDVEGSFTGKYVIRQTADLGNDFNTYTSLPNLYVVTKVIRGLFPDESVGDMIYAKKFRMSTIADEVLYLNEGCLADIETEAEVTKGSKEHVKFNGNIEPGDIIRVAKDSGGYVEKIRIVWDENGKTSPEMTQGMLAGMERYYHTSDYNTNPFAYNGSASNVLYSAKKYSTGSYRVFSGYPVRVRESGIMITSWDLPANGYNDSMDKDKYLTEVWNITRVVTVTFGQDGKVTVKRGAASDIKPYDEFGKECSRIVNVSRFATIDGIVVVNGYSK